MCSEGRFFGKIRGMRIDKLSVWSALPLVGMLLGCASNGAMTSETSVASDCPPFVVASVADSSRYEKLHPRFAQAFAFLRRADLKTLSVGRYEIEKGNSWAMVQNASLKPFEGETQKAEVHAAFFDIQAPLDGPETFGLYKAQAVFEPFNADRDVGFAQVKSSPVTLEPGQFAIFSPVTGAHVPCLTTGTPCSRRKIVIKVRK